MDIDTIDTLYQKQKQFFKEGKTRNLKFRKEQLTRLFQTLKKYEGKIFEACRQDLGRDDYTTYLFEIGAILLEIKCVLKNLDKWAAPRRLKNSVYLFPSKSYVYYEPLGQVLIIGAWNYPFNLMLYPLIGSIAGGNCTILKPSEIVPTCSHVLSEIIQEAFDPGFVAIVEGGVEVSRELLNRKYDHIFFTGSRQTGQYVLEAAAKQFTPVTLELGGKAPCVVDQTVDLAVTAKRIIWGKLVNAGQTCIAPDHVFVLESVKEPLIRLMIEAIEQFYPDLASQKFQRIVNQHHFDRLAQLLEGQTIIYGGQMNKESCYIAPTLVDSPSLNDKIMEEEIFGPILPIMSFKNVDELIEMMAERPKPLAFYLFSKDKALQTKMMERISFGGGCINDTLWQAANSELPFGGVGDSGIGAYHGKHSFELFSHAKSVVKKTFYFDFSFRYPPNEHLLKWMKKLFP